MVGAPIYKRSEAMEGMLNLGWHPSSQVAPLMVQADLEHLSKEIQGAKDGAENAHA